MRGQLTDLKDDMWNADEWKFRPLRDNDCNPNQSVNVLPLPKTTGLASNMKFLLLGAIGSFEEARCFVVLL